MQPEIKTSVIQMDSVQPDGKIEKVHAQVTDVDIQPSLTYLNNIQDFNTIVARGTFSEPIIKQAIILSNKLYLLGGVCGTVIDIYITLANTIMEIETDNEELNEIMEHVLAMVNYNNPKTMMGRRKLHEEFLMDLFLNGGPFPYEKWESYDYFGKEYFLPMAVMPLNPLAIQIRPTQDGTGEVVTYQNGIYNSEGTPDISKNANSAQVIRSSNMKRFTRRGRQYYWWGVPFLTKAFSALATKERLRELDEATTQGLISLITIFSLYDEKNGINADKDAVLTFAQALQGKQGQARYLTWSGPVKSLVVGPSDNILKFSEKYHETDKDVADALGCPSVLLSGNMQGSNAEFAVKPMKSAIEDAQECISDWWTYLTYKVARLNNLKVKMVKCRWAAVNLDNEATITAKVNNARDRGLLSDTSASLKLGASSRLEEYLINKERKEQENPEQQFGKPPAVPFQGAAGLGADVPSTKQGGAGRPKKEEPKVAGDPVNQQKEKTNRKLDVKASMLNVANHLVQGMIENIQKDMPIEQKLDIPLFTAIQICNLFCSKIADELENPKEFVKASMADCNKYSIDRQQEIIQGSINEETCKKDMEQLINVMYKKYLSCIIDHKVEVE